LNNIARGNINNSIPGKGRITEVSVNLNEINVDQPELFFICVKIKFQRVRHTKNKKLVGQVKLYSGNDVVVIERFEFPSLLGKPFGH
jgi:hypothetical protein